MKPQISNMEREKNMARNKFLRNMYYIDHKYKNCPCYKCICGKCFCPMRLNYKPSADRNGDIPLSCYRDYYRPWELPNTKPCHSTGKYEKDNLPFYDKSDYNQNYKDWSKYHNPNLSTHKRTPFDKVFASRIKDPSDTEHRSQYKPYDVSDFPPRSGKKYDDNSTKLPTPGNYRTDYATNYIDHGLKPFVCPARVELDRLAALDAAQRSKYR